MDDRIKELIAVGASVTANCQPCLTYHVDKARENGAEEEEIQEAVAVGKTVRRGATVKMDRFISNLLNGSGTATECETAGDECCG